MNTVIHKANQRGHADFGWLDSYHSFSFGNYYDPEKIHFGALRVLNDDVVIGGRGFGFHPHDNMEIISIPLEGDLEHKDSLGSQAVIRSGDVQVMSAGTGIVHSEYNQSKTEPVKFLQIWIVPSRQNVKPRYDQITLGILEPNKFHLIVSPDPSVREYGYISKPGYILEALIEVSKLPIQKNWMVMAPIYSCYLAKSWLIIWS